MRFKFTNALFRWCSATAAQINDLFNEIRNWTVSSLSTDSLIARTVDTRHHEQRLAYLLSASNRHVETVNVGDPMVEVKFERQVPGTHSVVVYGFTWYRRRDGAGAIGVSPTAEHNRICWYDDNTATWNLADYDGSVVGLTAFHHEDAAWGCDHTFVNPWPDVGYGIGGILLEFGGSQCIQSLLAKDSEATGWPPAGQKVTKFGLFGQDSAGGRDGQATVWLFAEDNG